MARNSMFGMAGAGIAAAIGFLVALNSIGATLVESPSPSGGPIAIDHPNVTGSAGPIPAVLATQELRKFNSADELRAFLAGLDTYRSTVGVDFSRTSFAIDKLGSGGPLRELTTSAPEPEYSGSVGGTFTPTDHSSTNVQVQGVDEPDFVKNDGKYAYILSGGKLTIVEAFPAKDARVIAKVALDIQEGQYLQNMFLNNETLVIFYQANVQDYVIQQYDYRPNPVYLQKTHALVVDVSDRQDPKILHDYEISGNYNNARMIGNQVYLITTSDLYDYRNPVLPLIKESATTLVRPDVYYFENPELYYAFNTVTAIDINGIDAENAVKSETFMMNPASTMYMSEDNLYVAYEKNTGYPYVQGTFSHDRFFNVVLPLLPKEGQDKIAEIDADKTLSTSEKWDRISALLEETYNKMPESERNKLFADIQNAIQDYDAKIYKQSQMTVVHRIKVGGEGLVEYGARGEVPGRLLNQFSMDENRDRFRIATTSEFWSPYGESVLHNNVYVLDMDMKIVGSLEEIAKDESIYSSRFIGDKLYLVTFQRTDPFFVIDMSEDKPRLLGELKLPGYSNYLHPYDEDHIIGIGKETKENQYGGIEVQGLKLALFDVSDVHNPKVVDVVEIGGPGTDSEVLNDHKALLFDRERNVLSIPVSITPDYGPVYSEDSRYIQPKVWRGFYVFGVNPDTGFNLKGKVEHFNDTADYYYAHGTQGSRSFYIDNVLYTVTLNNLIKMNDLQDLHGIGQLELGPDGGIIKYPEPVPQQETDAAEPTP